MKSIVLCSGGLDSTVLVYKAHSEGREVHMLTFNYGQRHGVEIQYAKRTSAVLGLTHGILDMRVIGLYLKSALTDRTRDIPEGHYEDESMKATVVPNRNAIMLAIAFGIAASIGAKEVYYAAHSGDHEIYSDCRPEFVNAFCEMELWSLSPGERISLCTPFLHFKKQDIVLLGQELRVPWIDTFSCYKGGSWHCGRCGTCVERKEAFKLAGVEDPTSYLI